MNIGTESETIEFRKSLAQLDKGLRSISAMLNASGKGTVYFGVNKDGEVNRKVVLGKNTFAEIKAAAAELLDPQPALDIQGETTEDGIPYIIVSAEAAEPPYAYDGRFFIRRGTEDEPLSVQELKDMILKLCTPAQPQYTEPAKSSRRITLNANQQRVLSYLAEHPQATLQDAADVCGLSLPGVKKIVAKLQDLHHLQREGSRKIGSWKAINNQ